MATWVGYPRSYTAGRARPPQYVTLHYTAGSEGPTSAEDGAAYDKSRTDGTSTHYFTDSAGPALQEVPDTDRSHAALFHGNEIGIHIEICGTAQTRAQWLDPVSYATLVTTAALTREICLAHGFQLRRLTVDETRAAYYGKDRPTGINDHGTVTAAYPEDDGDHGDVGPEFPWDVFMQLVTEGDDAMTNEEFNLLWANGWITQQLASMTDPIKVPPHPSTSYLGYTAPNLLAQALRAAVGGDVDEQAIADALAANDAFLAALKPATPAEIADAVVDEERDRLAE